MKNAEENFNLYITHFKDTFPILNKADYLPRIKVFIYYYHYHEEKNLLENPIIDIYDENNIKEFEQNKKYLEYVMNQKKEAEIWMDKIAQEEADKEYKKEQEEWFKEDQKRIQLLKDVYKEREEALKLQKKNAIIEDSKEVDKQIDEYYNKLEEINKAEALKRKQHQIKYFIK